MVRILSIIALVVLIGCSTDQEDREGSLEHFFEDREVVLDNVIACAASDKNDDQVSVFFYPRDKATNLQYFETEDLEVDKNDFSSYSQKAVPLVDIFNGYLKKFEVSVTDEKWVIVAFEEDGKVHISNPIRLKQRSKPTEYLPQNLLVDADTTMPNFSWEDGSYDDTKIYFQVISDGQENLISGTYTFEKMFRFYDLDNVVLNITKGMPTELEQDATYRFTLMAVSEDNWVNQFSEIDFHIN